MSRTPGAIASLPPSPLHKQATIRLFEFMSLTSTPAGFEPALMAPEGVAHLALTSGNVPCGKPFWTDIGHGADSRRSRPCRSPMFLHEPRSDCRVSLTLQPAALFSSRELLMSRAARVG